ncbi:sterol 3-beta-glucosyltransferase [Trifolium pratense]|uniref:Sterol 3-beta-glucosyltransferase n=1 Tax=Trifolium pratense TaxID=57577 RepID=A0A2K3LLS1_TRIPR|nr:sterol 3-beta-glucosyltransferase [Trifolium pratense]
MANNNNNNLHRSNSSSSDISVYLDAKDRSINSASSGRIDRDSSSVSQNVEESGADAVLAEAEPENQGYSKKDADKVVKNSGLLTRNVVVKILSGNSKTDDVLRWLKKASMVKDDGTVEIDVPGNIRPRSPENGTGVLDPSDESCNETIIEDIQPIRPQQIAMLIVGTRGDVQPFVAIGKRLQVLFVLGFFGSTIYTVIIY